MSNNRYTICADGGGSKLQLLLFDEQYRLCGTGRSGPVNGNYTRQTIQQQIQLAVSECIRDIPPGSIQQAILSAPGMYDAATLFFEEIGRHSPEAQSLFISEGKACLLAGCYQTHGFVALSGTGSGIFRIDGEQEQHMGGWGYLLGDFGSGFLIGQYGLQAAIQDYEGWGEKTVLTQMACQEYGTEQLWDILEPIYRHSFPVKRIAAFCRSVGKAADMGDHAAIEILRRAADEIAAQTTQMLVRYPEEHPTVVVSGGSWKCSRLLYEFFRERMLVGFTSACILKPVFEPVMGGVILALQKQFPTSWMERTDKLKQEFRSFLYQPDS